MFLKLYFKDSSFLLAISAAALCLFGVALHISKQCDVLQVQWKMSVVVRHAQWISDDITMYSGKGHHKTYNFKNLEEHLVTTTQEVQKEVGQNTNIYIDQPNSIFILKIYTPYTDKNTTYLYTKLLAIFLELSLRQSVQGRHPFYTVRVYLHRDMHG